MPPTTPLEPQTTIDPSLLERAHLALQSLQFEEQAARYRAAYSALLEAIADAQSGNEGPLRAWLEQRSPWLHPSAAMESPPASHPLTPRIDPLAPAPYGSQPEAATVERWSPKGFSSWDAMQSASLLRGHSLPNALPNVRPLTRRIDPAHAPAENRASESTSPASNAIPAMLPNEAIPVHPEQLDPPESSEPFASEDLDALLVGDTLCEDEPCVDEPCDADLASDPAPAWLLESADSKERADTTTNSQRPWWRAGHVWVSLAVHGAILVSLGMFVMTSVKPDILRAIVAGEVESDNVLTETPMEMPANMESATEAPAALQELLNPSPQLPGLDGLPSIAGVGPALQSNPLSSGLTAGLSGTGGRGGSTSSGLMAGTEFFGTKAVGNTFIYVVDASPSMQRDRAFDEAKREILRSLASMKPKQRFFIQFFGKEIEPLTFRGQSAATEPVPATKENLAKTIEWIERVPIQKDGRPPIDAIRAAIAMQPDGIFLLFDGDTKVNDWTGRIRNQNISNDLFSDGSPTVPIHVIHFFREEFMADMQRLAKENSGTYRFVPRPAKPNGFPNK